MAMAMAVAAMLAAVNVVNAATIRATRLIYADRVKHSQEHYSFNPQKRQSITIMTPKKKKKGRHLQPQ